MSRVAHIEQKNRKRTRRNRASIHAAMSEAKRMKRSKKRGTADMDANMERLGYRRVGPDGAGLPPEEKFAPVN